MPHSFTQGLHEVAEGTFAYLQPSGAWGLSNAGLIVDGDQSLLVDTLFDRRHTEVMLDEMRRVVGRPAERIDTVLNTHANGDHCWGNELVREARIVASTACKEEMAAFPPRRLALLMTVARTISALGPLGTGIGRIAAAVGLKTAADLVKAAPFVAEAFADFDFSGIELVLPNEVFDGHTTVTVGDTTVELYEVGPAHTRGDVIAYVPSKRIVFTGDILFANAHPIMWEGPSDNWVDACHRICALDVDAVVPGHGPITDTQAVADTGRYLERLRAEAKLRWQAGMSPQDAARDIDLGEFAEWTESERVVANVHALYRELKSEPRGDDTIALFSEMAQLAATRS